MYSPTLDEFLKFATQGNLIPVTRCILADLETPLSAYRKIRGAGESFLFESVEGGEHLGRYSFVGCNPRAVIRQRRDTVELVENGKVKRQFLVSREHKPEGSDTAIFTAGEIKTHGKVEELAVSCEAPPASVRDGLEVVAQ